MKKTEVFREKLIAILREYYTRTGRGDIKKRPDFEDYTIQQLQSCISILRL